jgi:hypothetical protein
MKKLLILLFVAFTLNANAQYITNFAKNVNCKETDGFYYHLPRNIIKVDFTIEKTQDIKGKYHSFAKELLNTDKYIKENRTTYSIKSVNINTLTEADPNMVFHIITSTDDKNKESVALNLELNSEGVISSFGNIANSAEKTSQTHIIENEFSYSQQPDNYYYIPIVDTEDEESNEKMTEQEIALTIIEEIKKLRLAHFDLITGYQEVNYGNTIKYMVEQINDLENEYLSMFIGKTNSEIFTQTFYIIPEEGKNSIIISKFSESEGFNNKAGESVKINFIDNSASSNINKLSKDDIETVTYTNKLFYRNPANVTMQVLHGEKKIAENRLKISQLGSVCLIPINKMKLTFDTNTGQILSIIKE